MSKLKGIIKRLSGFTVIDNYFRQRHTGFPGGERYARGHFYSPLPDIHEVNANAGELFRKDVNLEGSIDLRAEEQFSLIKNFAEHYYQGFQWPVKALPEFRFHFDQDWYCQGDALNLHCVLRYLKPKKIIEVGSGFSSAMMLDTNDRFLESGIRFTFIDPYPERLFSILREEDRGRCKIVDTAVQAVDLQVFEQLEANDILFVDSSHVSKIGSDVNHLLFNVLPVLKPGVLVHFHDIFWPFEYPREWVTEKRAWNEAYILRAFLQFNSSYQIFLFNSYVEHAFSEYMADHMPLFLENSGGSLWIRKL
jgi:predicted O-methyltransferase YrrM